MATYTNKNGTNEADVLTYNKAGTYYAYSGKDTITIDGGSGVIVHAGAGNNVINVTGGYGHTVKSAYTEAEGEKIASADKLTIDDADVVDAILGSGRDEIVLNITDGRKSDGSLAKIKGGSWTDTFTVNRGAQRYQLYGEAGDDIFNITQGTNIVCWGGAANDTFNVTGGTGIKLRGGDSADVYNISVAGVDMQLGYGNDIVTVTAGDNQKIKANLGINTINLQAGSGHVITADIDQVASKKAGKNVGYGVDKVYITDYANNVTANLGDGKDIVEVSVGSKHKISTEGWGDTITVGAQVTDSEFYAGAGDDVITVEGASGSIFEGEEGNDTISLTSTTKGCLVSTGSGENKLYLSSSVRNLIFGGDDVDKLVLYGNNTYNRLYAGKGDDTINIAYASRSSSYNAIYGGEGKDEFILDGGNYNTCYGGAGNDTFTVSANSKKCLLVGGAGADKYKIEAGASVAIKVEADGTNTVDTLTINGASAASLDFTLDSANKILKINDIYISNYSSLNQFFFVSTDSRTTSYSYESLLRFIITEGGKSYTTADLSNAFLSFGEAGKSVNPETFGTTYFSEDKASLVAGTVSTLLENSK